MSWKTNLLQFFTWWNGSTWGTRLHLWRKGEHVGADTFGNVYYVTPDGERYVQYAGEAEASTVPPGWSGWLHHRTDVPPTESDYVAKGWELPHKPNMTGTPMAYRPKGSILRPGERPTTQQAYEAWTPDGAKEPVADRPKGSGSDDYEAWTP